MFALLSRNVSQKGMALLGEASSSLQIINSKSFNYRASDLWRSVLTISNQGAKTKDAMRRKGKDMNIGQEYLKGSVLFNDYSKRKPEDESLPKDEKLTPIGFTEIVGIDHSRQERLNEIRGAMDVKYKHGQSAYDRGFTGTSIEGKSIGEPISYDNVDFTGYDTRIITFKTQLFPSTGGKKKYMNCFVATGNGNGIIGIGKATALLGPTAMKNAKTAASKRLMHINLFENRTLFHSFYEEYYYTRIFAEKGMPGSGVKGNRIILLLCKLIGIKDIHVRVEGSLNPMNIVKGFLTGLLNQKTYKEIANEFRLHLVEFKPERNNFPLILASPTVAEAIPSKKKEHANDRNLSLYLLNDATRFKKKRQPYYATYDTYKKYLYKKDLVLQHKKARLERIRSLPDSSVDPFIFPRKVPLKLPNPPKKKKAEE